MKEFLGKTPHRKKVITRYYRNQKTGQYAKLLGSPIAIRRIETIEWPRRQGVIAVRVSGREYRKNRVPIGDVVDSFGWVITYKPAKYCLKNSRNGRDIAGHQVSFYYQ